MACMEWQCDTVSCSFTDFNNSIKPSVEICPSCNTTKFTGYFDEEVDSGSRYSRYDSAKTKELSNDKN